MPDVHIESRPRMSVLSYAGSKNIARLPPRCAIVAFSVNDVYAIAEHIRQQKGGSALVLGALSPNTRNQQVAMYQAGEVDYLVATDAIGMGLNMDVDHVAFANAFKFDGHLSRALYPAEIAQIAGRAGRHMNNGTFGVTNGLSDFDANTIEAIETHTFAPEKFIYWRNRDLNFNSPTLLLKSLKIPPHLSGISIPNDKIRRIRGAEDSNALESLMSNDDIIKKANSPDMVQLLWDVCQIPDFCQISPEIHSQFLQNIFTHLYDALKNGGVPNLPHDFMAGHIEKLNRTDGTIDTLTMRLANIRTWSYITHKDLWLSDSKHWQHRTRQIEDDLSNTLHQRLMNRFVDERTSVLFRKDKHSKQDLILNANGIISLHNQPLGTIKGITFIPHLNKESPMTQQDKDAKTVRTIANPLLQDNAPLVVAQMEQSPATDFTINMQTGDILWQNHRVAHLQSGNTALTPKVTLGDTFVDDSPLQNRLKITLEKTIQSQIDHTLKPLLGIDDSALKDIPLSADARAILYGVYNGMGTCRRTPYEQHISQLTADDKTFFAKQHIRIGIWFIYLGRTLSAKACRLRALLACIHHGEPISPLTFKTKAKSAIESLVPAETLSPKIWEMTGYIAIQGHEKHANETGAYESMAIRIDHWEQLTYAIRTLTQRDKNHTITDITALQALFPENQPHVQQNIMGFAGYKPTEDGHYKRIHQRPKPMNKNPMNKKPRNQTKEKSITATPPKKKDSVNTDSPFAVLMGRVEE